MNTPARRNYVLDEVAVVARDLREAIPHDLRGAAMDWAARRLEALAQLPPEPGESIMTHPHGVVHEMGDAAFAHAQIAPRIGDWMTTANGRKFWPLDPRPDEVHIDDIAQHLSKICRFNGACFWHYSVAQHSIYTSHIVAPESALTALMHDAPEAYCCDIHRPLKRGLPKYQQIEERIWQAIATRYGLPLKMPQCVNEADEAMLMAENAQIMPPGDAWTYRYPVAAADVCIRPWTPEMACTAFIRRFEELSLAKNLAARRH